MTKVFLSYTRPDRERVTAIKILLELGGAEVFLDWRSVAPGVPWEKTIEDALAGCDVLCVFWSAATPKSEWVQREYETFLAKYPDRPCVPLCADDTPLPAALAKRQAPPEFLSLCNELLASRRELTRLGVSRREIDRSQRALLAKYGVNVDDAQWKKLAIAFGAGAFATLGARPLAAKIIAGLLAALTTISLVWLRCQLGREETVHPSPGHRGSAQAVADAASHAKGPAIDFAPKIAPLPVVALDDCPPEPAIVPTETPHVAVTSDPVCDLVDQILRDAQHNFPKICSGKTSEDGWSTSVTLKGTPCVIIGRPSTKDGPLDHYILLCELPTAARNEAFNIYDDLEAHVAACLPTNDGWKSKPDGSTDRTTTALMEAVEHSRVSLPFRWYVRVILSASTSVTETPKVTLALAIEYVGSPKGAHPLGR